MKRQECLQCGMELPSGTVFCPKCDNVIGEQTDGSTVTVDIGHQGHSSEEAMQEMREVIDRHKAEVTQYLRLVVGKGKGKGQIRDKAESELRFLQHRKVIKDFDFDGGNTGAFMIRLK